MKRREFLKAGLSATAVVTIPGLLSLPRRADAAVLDYFIVVEAVDKPVYPTMQQPVIPMWQYIDSIVGSQLLELTVTAGDIVNIILQNNLSVAVDFTVRGLLEGSQPCLPGQIQSYSFVAPATPGTFLFYDSINGELGKAMGLSGGLRILPSDGIARLYDGGPTYHRDHLLIFYDVDTRLNEAVAAGNVFDMSTYQPNYFFVNGITYTPSQHVELQMIVGENVAIRFVNAGLIYYPMHFHGYHVNVATRNRMPEISVIEKDTVLVKISECVEVILPVSQPGLYPLHSHFVPAVTNNGYYSGGGLIMINAA